jgi:diaminohydroxyphosphoribosylaminopyrimidine deaminase/5-amino-6-(5-phosphoribosylamino)uracil reductase
LPVAVLMSVASIGDRRRLRILDVERLGGDLYLRAVPVTTPTTAHPSGTTLQEG